MRYALFRISPFWRKESWNKTCHIWGQTILRWLNLFTSNQYYILRNLSAKQSHGYRPLRGPEGLFLTDNVRHSPITQVCAPKPSL